MCKFEHPYTRHHPNCGCDGAVDDGCYCCTPEQHPEGWCPYCNVSVGEAFGESDVDTLIAHCVEIGLYNAGYGYESGQEEYTLTGGNPKRIVLPKERMQQFYTDRAARDIAIVAITHAIIQHLEKILEQSGCKERLIKQFIETHEKWLENSLK